MHSNFLCHMIWPSDLLFTANDCKFAIVNSAVDKAELKIYKIGFKKHSKIPFVQSDSQSAYGAKIPLKLFRN